MLPQERAVSVHGGFRPGPASASVMVPLRHGRPQDGHHQSEPARVRDGRRGSLKGRPDGEEASTAHNGCSTQRACSRSRAHHSWWPSRSDDACNINDRPRDIDCFGPAYITGGPTRSETGLKPRIESHVFLRPIPLGAEALDTRTRQVSSHIHRCI